MTPVNANLGMSASKIIGFQCLSLREIGIRAPYPLSPRAETRRCNHIGHPIGEFREAIIAQGIASTTDNTVVRCRAFRATG
jgi:hypothetical protein